MINSKIDIHQATNRIAPAQAMEGIPPSSPSKPLHIDGWSIQVVDDALIITGPGITAIGMRPGKAGSSVPLGQTEVVIRRDPPAAPNAQATELLK